MLKIAKIIITSENLPFLPLIINRIEQKGIKRVKFVLPFKLDKNDSVPSLMEAAPNIAIIKNYVQKKGIEILSNQKIENNPYLPQDVDFFDTKTVELKINFQKYKNKPKFSVIIPTFNKKDSLKFVLNNFFNQKYPKSRYEIIVIDDGSNDKTLESMKKIKPACNFKYFYWSRKKIKLKDDLKKWAEFYNRVGLARNIGIEHAQGDIILFNDADILVTKDCLKKHEVYHKKYSNVVVRGFRMFLPLPNKFKPSIKKLSNFKCLNRISHPEKNKREKKMHCRLHDLSQEGWQRIVTADLSIRKKYLEEVGGFSHDFVSWGFEDVDLGYRLSKLDMRLMWDDKIKVYHLYHKREAGGELKDLLAFWVGTNILYRKYLDEKIYHVYRDVIMYKLDNLML